MSALRSLADKARISTGEMWRIFTGSPNSEDDQEQVGPGAHRGDRSNDVDAEVPATYDRNVFVLFMETEFPNLAADKISAYPAAAVWDVLVPRRHLRGVLHMAHEATGCRKATYDKFCTHEKVATALINEILAKLRFDGITVTCRHPKKLTVRLASQ